MKNKFNVNKREGKIYFFLKKSDGFEYKSITSMSRKREKDKGQIAVN